MKWWSLLDEGGAKGEEIGGYGNSAPGKLIQTWWW